MPISILTKKFKMSKYSSTYLSHDICYLLFALRERSIPLRLSPRRGLRSTCYLQTESLPLLQFALDELWRERTPGKITLANYQENISGLGAILGKKKLNLLIKH
jgi:hypothetical protein